MKNFILAKKKIKSQDGLKKIIQRHQKKGKKVVFTNGVFDLLHLGHIRYLEKAKSLGDILVVALNTDVSVKKVKGNHRPIIPEKERSELIASLGCVDYVTLFEDEIPLKIIDKLRPDILVKGADYKLTEIVGMKEVREWGGKVIRIPFVKGYSTTQFIDRIMNLRKD